MSPRRSPLRECAILSLAGFALLCGCASQDASSRDEPRTPPLEERAVLALPPDSSSSRAPPDPVPPSAPDPSLGMIIVAGRWLQTSLVYERTETTLLVNGVDVAPPSPEGIADEDAPPAGEPDSFQAVCLRATRQYWKSCAQDGVAGLEAARIRLISTLRESELVGSVEEGQGYVIARSPNGEVDSLELCTDAHDVESLRSILEAEARDRNAAAAERRRKGLDEIEARLRYGEKSGSLVLIQGLDGNGTYPPAEGRGKWLGIHRVMRDTRLDREGRVRELARIVRSTEIAEQIADHFQPLRYPE